MIEIKNSELSEVQLYWLELWEELLNTYTIEPYSVPVVNLYCLLEELKNTDNPKEQERRFEEIKKSNIGLKKDFVAKETSISLTHLLNDEPSDGITKIKNMNYLKEDEYFSQIAFKLYLMLSSEDTIDIKKLEFLTKIFIAELINRKFSWYYLQTRPSIFTRNKYFKNANFQFKLNYLFSSLLRDSKEWSVIFKVTLKKDVLNIEKYQNLKFLPNDDSYINEMIKGLKKELDLLRKEQKEIEVPKDVYDKSSQLLSNIDDLKNFTVPSNKQENIEQSIKKVEQKLSFLTKSDGKIFVKVTNISASDPNSIQKIAKNHLLRFMNTIRYNSPNISFHSNSIDCNTLIENKYSSILVPKEKSSNYKKNLKFRLEEINKHFIYIDNCQENELKYELQDIMHFYGMYLDAQYDSEKFLSLWIALEKLCDVQQGEAIGATVSQSVSTIITLYHLKKILRNLWLDFQRFDLCGNFIEQFEMSIDENSRIKEEELFFLLKINSKEILEKIEEKTNSKILYERVKKLSQAFKSANNICSYIYDYKYDVENSLWRLYSIRNKIAHEAYIDTDLTLYINQLDYFFKITYNSLLYASTLKKFYSTKDIIKKYNERYNLIWGTQETQQGAFAYKFFKPLNNNMDKREIDSYLAELKGMILDPIPKDL